MVQGDADAGRSDAALSDECAHARQGAHQVKLQVVRRGIGGRVQKQAARTNSWTAVKRKRFMEALAATCNVSEAARVAKISVASAYKQKQKDCSFARDWDHALGVGYAELEAVLLHEALFGSEAEEVVLDGDGAVKSRKVKRGRDRGVALRLLGQHAARASQIRAEELREKRAGSDAVDRLRQMIAAVREKTRTG